MNDPQYSPTDRRPIASRELGASKRAADWLVRRGISANAVSTAGMAAGVLAGMAFAATAWLDAPWAVRAAWLAGAGFVQLRLIANMLDGMVAIGSQTASPIGELFNEVPDRVSDVATLVGLGYAVGGDPVWGYWAAVFAVTTAYIRAVGKGSGVGQVFIGPFAKPQRMFVATVVGVLGAVLPVAWQGPWVWTSTGLNGGPATVGLVVVAVGSAVTCVRRLQAVAGLLKEKGTQPK